MAENLRVKAAHEPGAEGAVGARAVADAIELRLIEDIAEPVTLGGNAVVGSKGKGSAIRVLWG